MTSDQDPSHPATSELRPTSPIDRQSVLLVSSMQPPSHPATLEFSPKSPPNPLQMSPFSRCNTLVYSNAGRRAGLEGPFCFKRGVSIQCIELHILVIASFAVASVEPAYTCTPVHALIVLSTAQYNCKHSHLVQVHVTGACESPMTDDSQQDPHSSAQPANINYFAQVMSRDNVAPSQQQVTSPKQEMTVLLGQAQMTAMC